MSIGVEILQALRRQPALEAIVDELARELSAPTADADRTSRRRALLGELAQKRLIDL